MLVAPLVATDPEFFYHYKGQKIALDLDEDNVAVKLKSQKNGGERPPEGAAKNFANQAKSLGYERDEAASFRPGGWIKLGTKSAEKKARVSPQAAKKDKERKLIDDLANVDDVEFVSPVFRDAKGQPVTFEPMLLVGFLDGTNEAVQNSILAKIAKVKSVARHGPKNKWIVEINSKSGLELLDAANAIATLPGVRYAEPNFALVATAL